MSPSGLRPFGVTIDVVDKANSTIVSGLRSNDTNVKVEGLPYFAHFTVTARALYENNDEVVESDAVAKVIGTGRKGWLTL